MRHFLRAAAIVSSLYPILIYGLAAAWAEPIPLPNVDYQAKATMMGGSAVTIHHSGGKLRMEIQPHGLPATITGIMDFSTHKMIMIGAIPGMNNMAMEIDIGTDASYGQVIGEGKRVGTATVAGESCELWQVESKVGFNSGPVTACLSRDNIPLRTEATVEGKPRVIMEVTELQRTRQDPALFVLPANVQIVKLPKGVMPGTAAPGKQ
jgi:hypothetical protein